MIVQPTSGLTPTAADKRYLQLSGGTMTGEIAMGNHKVTGVATPTADTDAVNKKYVDESWRYIPVPGIFYIEYKHPYRKWHILRN